MTSGDGGSASSGPDPPQPINQRNACLEALPAHTHPIMRTSVIFLAATMSCAGSTSENPAPSMEATGGSADQQASAGGISATGGSTDQPQGGAGGLSATGGSGGERSSAMGGAKHMPSCEPEQWTCPDAKGCEIWDPVRPQDCECDDSRPGSPAECQGSEVFVCLFGYVHGEDGPASRIRYQCECVPVPVESDCSTACAAHSSGWQWQNDCGLQEQSDGDVVDCTCQLTLQR